MKPNKKPNNAATSLAFVLVIAFIALLMSPGLLAQTDSDETESQPAPERKLVEIYRIAPGKHEEFLRFIAFLDDINIEAGLPPRDLYIHSDGADWDFIIIQPASTPPDKADALSKAWDESGAPSGANFFLHIRQFIAEHSDTFATGPVSASEYLEGVDSDD